MSNPFHLYYWFYDESALILHFKKVHVNPNLQSVKNVLIGTKIKSSTNPCKSANDVQIFIDNCDIIYFKSLNLVKKTKLFHSLKSRPSLTLDQRLDRVIPNDDLWISKHELEIQMRKYFLLSQIGKISHAKFCGWTCVCWLVSCCLMVSSLMSGGYVLEIYQKGVVRVERGWALGINMQPIN